MKRSLSPWSQHKLVLWLSVTVVATAGIALAERFPISVTVNAQSPTPPAAYQDRFITTKEGRRIHYLDWGTAGEAAIHHAPRHQSIRPHLRSHRPSSSARFPRHRDGSARVRRLGLVPKGEYLVEDFVRDLHELVEQLNLRDIVMTGNSMGGRVVQVYRASSRPNGQGHRRGRRAGRPESVTTTLTQRIQVRPRGGRRRKDCWPRCGEGRREFRKRRIAIGFVMRPSCRTGVSSGNTIRTSRRGSARGPLEIHQAGQGANALHGGRHSNLVPRETQEQLKALPHIEVVTIPDAGHYPHLDTPVVWLAVVAFLAG